MVMCEQGEEMLLHVMPAGKQESDAREIMDPALHVDGEPPIVWEPRSCGMMESVPRHSQNPKIYMSMSMIISCLGRMREENSAEDRYLCATHLLAKS